MADNPANPRGSAAPEPAPAGPWTPPDHSPEYSPEYVQPVAPVRAPGGGRRLLAAGGLVLVLLGALVASTAAMSGPVGSTDQPAAAAPADPGTAPVVNAVASPSPAASPDTRSQNCQDYLDNLATRLNVSVDTLQKAMLDATGDTIDQMVKDGRITSDEAALLKGRLSTVEGSLCTAGPGVGKGMMGGMMMPFGPGMGGRGGGDDRGGPGVRADAIDETVVLDAAASALKIDRTTLLTEIGALKSGEDLKTIAQKHGVAYDTLTAAVHAAVKGQLDAAVSKGTITADQETRMLERLDDQLAEGRLGFGMGFGMPGGRGGHMGGRGQMGGPGGECDGTCPGASPSASPGTGV